jgi:hypothetical protein
VLKKVTGKRKIDLPFDETSYLNCRAYNRFDSWLKVFCKFRPRVESNSPACNDFVDKRAISATDIKNAIIWTDLPTEIMAPQSPPEDFPPRVGGKANVMVSGRHLVGSRHSVTIPRIIRSPRLMRADC